MLRLRLVCLTLGCLAVRATLATAQAPTLAFSTADGYGPGIYSAVSVHSDTDRIVVKGRIVLGENCRRLTGFLTVASRDTLILELRDSRVGNVLCGREETPMRYRAAISPLAPGAQHVRVTYRNLGGNPIVLGETEAVVPYDR